MSMTKENDIAVMSSKIESLETELNQLNTYGRRQNIEISGVPDHIRNDELESEIIGFLRSIGVHDLCHNEISACHRLKYKVPGEKHHRVIVRFINRKRAEQCIRNRRYIRYTRAANDVNIYENMTPFNKKLIEKCKQLKDGGSIETFWFNKGVVHIRRPNEHHRVVRILHSNDIDRFISNANRGLNPS